MLACLEALTPRCWIQQERGARGQPATHLQARKAVALAAHAPNTCTAVQQRSRLHTQEKKASLAQEDPQWRLQPRPTSLLLSTAAP